MRQRPDIFSSSSHASLQDQLLETKLRLEREKLAKVEAERLASTKDADPKYTRYEDMPPPSPEDEAAFYERFKLLVGLVDEIEEVCPHCQKRLPSSPEDYAVLGLPDPVAHHVADIRAKHPDL